MNQAQHAEVPLDSAQRGRGPYIWRFNLFHRWITHAFAMISFYVLILTGLPLRFACAPFAEPLMRFWGGVERAGLIHRWMAGFMVAYTAVHIVYIAVRFFRDKDKKRWLWGSDTPWCRTRRTRRISSPSSSGTSARGRGRVRPLRLPREDGLFRRGLGLHRDRRTGFMLWFPEFFGRWLPGWLFNVATVFHAYEAMIAAAFLFTIHFFNVHLRPDKFPLDAVMFTGRGTLDYMIEEHPGMEEELRARANEPISHRAVHDLPAPPPSRTLTLVGTFLGFVTWGIGLATSG
jgi:hypothetical protein